MNTTGLIVWLLEMQRRSQVIRFSASNMATNNNVDAEKFRRVYTTIHRSKPVQAAYSKLCHQNQTAPIWSSNEALSYRCRSCHLSDLKE